MDNLLQKSKKILIYIIIAMLPVMTYINLFGKIKVNVSVADIFIGLLAIVTLLDFKNFSLRRNFPHWWYFAGLILWSIISNTIAYYNQNIVSGSILHTINELIKFAISGLYFYVGYNSFKDREDYKKVLRVWIYTAAVVSVIGIFVTINLYLGNMIQDGLFIHSDTGAKRLVGTLTDPNLAAAYLNLSFWISAMFYNVSESKVYKYFAIVACVLIFISMLLTQSRSGIISFIIGLLVFIAFKFHKIYKYLPIIIPFLFILYFGILNIDASYFDNSFYNSTVRRFEQVAEGTGEWEIRSNLSKAAFMMGKENFIFGVGRGNYVNNSKIYYEKIGIDTTSSSYEWNYGIKIPHNTYATFFAELGIIGLALFSVIFFMVGKKIIGSKNILFIAMLITYMVQAFAVNLENFRGIWFVLPFAVLVNGVEVATYNKLNENIDKRIFSRYAVTCIVMIFIAVIMLLDTAPKYSKPITLGVNPVVDYVDDVASDEEYILRYYIEGQAEEEDKPSSFIKVYAIDKDGQKGLIHEISHYNPKGYAYIPFIVPNHTRRIAIEAVGTSDEQKVIIKDVLLVNKNTGKADRLFADSKYLPNCIEGYLADIVFYKKKVEQDIDSYKLFANTFVTDDAEIETTTKQTILYFKGDKAINISDRILFLGAIKEKVDGNKIKITLKFKCIDKINKEYSLWLHAGVIDQGIVSESRKQYGFENWDHEFKIKTTEWQIGQIYDDTFEIEVNEGQYDMKFGFWNAKRGEKLYPMIYLGWTLFI
ncbi:O-antigen ligase family protein [Lutispora thermophila]|uniref:O-antigen ligase n=1 Tax=Lutispora thermophila DSM 19022 TaxID=1122184 RepID=A0A1M6BX15_9FIRM|nr:O-antigen ligase family protein [Lutispora thermophila]SHI53207.1 O-antigen ligase [Lutispora thermophila DSM 19022]